MHPHRPHGGPAAAQDRWHSEADSARARLAQTEMRECRTGPKFEALRTSTRAMREQPTALAAAAVLTAKRRCSAWLAPEPHPTRTLRCTQTQRGRASLLCRPMHHTCSRQDCRRRARWRSARQQTDLLVSKLRTSDCTERTERVGLTLASLYSRQICTPTPHAVAPVRFDAPLP